MKKFQWMSSALVLLLPLVSSASSLTISGISSGGFMASQMAVIYSDQFSGVATVAGGVFYCAQNTYQQNLKEYGNTAFFNYGVSQDVFKAGLEVFNVKNIKEPSRIKFTDMGSLMAPLPSNPFYHALGICMAHPERAHGSEPLADGSPGAMNLDFLSRMEEGKLIAPLANIKKQKVLVYQGTADKVVKAEMAEKLQEFYSRMGVSAAALKMIQGKGAGHNFPTMDKDGLPCSASRAPYISNCRRDLAGSILEHLVGRNLRRGQASAAHLYRVQQPEAPKSIASYGYLYANDFCLSNPTKCDLHVALHGCEMSDSFDENFDKLYRSRVQMTKLLQVANFEMNVRMPKMGALTFAQKSGYADYAEEPSNRLMVLFPQTQITEENYPGNPKGCWDWYGWADNAYATNQGREPQWLISQIRKVRENPASMIMK